MNSIDLALRLLLASLFGGLIGFEREIQGRAAGLRTHILVCMGSALIMLCSIYSCQIDSAVGSYDPSRIAAGVVTGLGFLGGGTILRYGASVKGLTTAASLWTVGGIGLAVGSGFYSAASIATAIVLITLAFVSKFERKLSAKGLFKKARDEESEEEDRI